MALIAHYPLNGDTKDYSGYGRDLTEVGTIAYESGVIGNALSVNGQYLASSEVSEYLHGKPEASIAMWVKKNDLSYGIFQLSGFKNSNGNLYPYQTNDKVYMDTFRTNRIGAITVANVNEWHHLVITQKHGANGWKLYQNGLLVTQQTADATVSTDYGVFEIGRNSGSRYANGLFNDIRIYDHALSDKEVKELAKAKVLHYKFDEQDLTTKIVKDCSGFGNDGTVAVATAPSWSEDSPVGRGSMEFNGGKFITLPNMLGGEEQITVCAWFKTNGLGGSGYHIIMGGTEVELDVTSAGNARFGLIIDNVRQVHNYSSGLADGKYHHICGVYDGTVKDVYVDGVLVGSHPVTGKIKNNITRRVGVFGTQTNYHANGNISDVRIYATALTPEDILELYQTRASVDNEGNLFVQEIDEITDTSKEVDSRGIARFKEFNEVDGENKMSIKNDGVVYVNEIMEA